MNKITYLYQQEVNNYAIAEKYYPHLIKLCNGDPISFYIFEPYQHFGTANIYFNRWYRWRPGIDTIPKSAKPISKEELFLLLL